MQLSSIPLVLVPCDHGTAESTALYPCKKCFGLGLRYIPKGLTVEEFDALTEPLRMFRRDA